MVPTAHPDSMMTIQQNSTFVDVFGRDLEALTLDPPAVTLDLRPSGQEKLLEFERTGRSAQLGDDDIVGLVSNLRFIQDTPATSRTLTVSRRSTAPIPCRVTFTGSKGSTVYDFVELDVVRVGMVDIEVRSKGPRPFRIHFTHEGDGRSTIQLDLNFQGFRPTEVAKLASVLRKSVVWWAWRVRRSAGRRA